MNYLYECGTCNHSSNLDLSKIPSSGAKITCPNCLSFFILQTNMSYENYIQIQIEPLAQENDSQLHSSSHIKLTPFDDTSASETVMFSSEKIILNSTVQKTTQNSPSPIIEEDELSFYSHAQLSDPIEQLNKPTRFDKALYYIILILVIISTIVFLAYKNYIDIPYLNKFLSSYEFYNPFK